MSILKALQKKQSEEQPQEKTAASKVVPFERNGRQNNTAPDLFGNQEFKIGTPTSSAFNEQSVSNFGMALPDERTEITAGATLNAVALTRPVEKQLPDFTSWKVQAERVEPRLVSITQPNSSYCEEYRSLRTHVLTKSKKQKLQAIVIASVGPAEGKSITALNLSWLLAQTDGVSALIIDSDLGCRV